jgi:succinoglycan biosynthesis transport protein ExoP
MGLTRPAKELDPDMDDEIDLRSYIRAVLKYKYWIMGLTLVAAAVALIASLLLRPVYEATALVAVIAPSYTMQFDPRFETTTNTSQPYKAYPALATSDEVLAALIDDLGANLGSGTWTVANLRKRLDASNAADPSIVEMQARFDDPARAATVVNRWATLLVDRANDLYGQDTRDLTFFEAQLAEAGAGQSRAEQELVAFQARNQAAILQAQLDSQQAAMEGYLAAGRSLRLIIQDARSLQERLSAQDPASRGSLGDDLASLLLQVDSLSQGNLPIQLQISGQQGLTERTVGEQIAFLESLIQTLENKQATLESESKALEPGILRLQEQVQQVNVEADRLSIARSLAQETFETLSRKVAEARIEAQNTVGDVRIASQALAPSRPISPRKALNTAIGGALGLIVAIAGALAIEYWQHGRSTP